MLKYSISRQSIIFCMIACLCSTVCGTINANATLPVIKRNSSSVSAGFNHSAAVTTDGSLWTWGNNYSGQLGIGTSETYAYTPAQVLLQDVIDIATGTAVSDEGHSVALKSDGTVWAWGCNNSGQLGTADCCTTNYTPTLVSGITGIIAIDAGNLHTIALDSDGTLWTWGKNEVGQIGNGSSTGYISTPYHIPNFSDVIAIAAGGNHNLVLKSDGTVWGWGDNSRGQLADNTITNRLLPVQVKNASNTGFLTDIIAISAGTTHSLALKSDGSVWVWGENSSGQGGQGGTGTTYFMLPVQVPGVAGVSYLNNVVAIASGEMHNIALLSYGQVVSWGSNNMGQLGNNSTSTDYYPCQVYNLTNVQSIDAGNYHNIVTKEDGSVWAWGRNTNGQVGDNYTTNREYPVQVLGSQNGFLNLGTYLPVLISMTEDTIKYVRFSMSDAEGGTFQISTTSDGNPPVETFYLICSQDSGTTITVTLAANESIDITLRLTPAANQYGSDEVNIVVTGDLNGILVEQSLITVLNASDAPSIVLDNQWTVMNSGVTADINDIFVLNSTNVYAAGYS
ncbi:MAG: hypothetical protein HQK75_05895, partial [Candidatus Magnetomorum sp.]|nr:hypothetical protein [Candidatus Magnetomorum sp.]